MQNHLQNFWACCTSADHLPVQKSRLFLSTFLTIYWISKLESHRSRSYDIFSALYFFLLNFFHFLNIIYLLVTTFFWTSNFHLDTRAPNCQLACPLLCFRTSIVMAHFLVVVRPFCSNNTLVTLLKSSFSNSPNMVQVGFILWSTPRISYIPGLANHKSHF